jgi:hypothetical protein
MSRGIFPQFLTILQPAGIKPPATIKVFHRKKLVAISKTREIVCVRRSRRTQLKTIFEMNSRDLGLIYIRRNLRFG